MSTLAMIELRGVNYFGRRFFLELRPTDNKDALEAEAVKCLKDIMIAMKGQTLAPMDTRGAKLISS